jgi:hypothetical protein
MPPYNTGLLTGIKKQKDQLWTFMELSESVKGLFKWQILKQPKLLQPDKVLHKWFTAMLSERKPVTWLMIIGKAQVFLWRNENN